tara:strand:- start:43842 stop:44267 length:426 start_codon:yes stop_codon:yes gene_type:complete
MGQLPDWLSPYALGYNCALVGGLGGVTYCLRAIYLNKCVKGQWSEEWHTWYYLRPLVSVLVGVAAYIFLNAGLLVLDAGETSQSSPYGFLALSFIAGLNVDRFLIKLEDLAQASWGIKPSRTSEFSSRNLKNENTDETKNS